MIMFWLGLLIIAVLLSLWHNKRLLTRFNVNTTPPKQTQQRIPHDETTVEDMILHDMNNDDETYDIGTIDFND